MIAGCRVDEQQRGGRHDEDEKDCEQDATSEESQQPAVHDEVFGSNTGERYFVADVDCDARLSALQSKCGICSAGVAPTTRGVVARVILGATK
jgi:hypothetical protein